MRVVTELRINEQLVFVYEVFAQVIFMLVILSNAGWASLFVEPNGPNDELNTLKVFQHQIRVWCGVCGCRWRVRGVCVACAWHVYGVTSYGIYSRYLKVSWKRHAITDSIPRYITQWHTRSHNFSSFGQRTVLHAAVWHHYNISCSTNLMATFFTVYTSLADKSCWNNRVNWHVTVLTNLI